MLKRSVLFKISTPQVPEAPYLNFQLSDAAQFVASAARVASHLAMAHPMARQPTQPMATGNPPLSPTSPTDSPKHHRKNALRGDEDFKHHPTVPSKCIVGGDGLHTAMAKKSSEFTIQAHDAEGQRQRAGGDRFIVSIRGASACRAP